MTLEEAKAQLAELVEAGTSPALSDADLLAALNQSYVIDGEGRAPGTAGYVPTWSLYWAASIVSTTRAIRTMNQDQLTEFTSEGSRFKVQATDWNDVAARFRALAGEEAGLRRQRVTLLTIDRSLGKEFTPRSQDPEVTGRGAITNAD